MAGGLRPKLKGCSPDWGSNHVQDDYFFCGEAITFPLVPLTSYVVTDGLAPPLFQEHSFKRDLPHTSCTTRLVLQLFCVLRGDTSSRSRHQRSHCAKVPATLKLSTQGGLLQLAD